MYENNIVLIQETENLPIYNYDKKQVIGGLQKYNNTRAVLMERDPDTGFFLLKFEDGAFGWSFLKDSLFIEKKENEVIKLIDSPDIYDRLFRKNQDLSEKYSKRLCYSHYRVEKDGEVYEAVTHRSRVIGFLKRDQYYSAFETNEQIIHNQELEIYRDSDFIIPLMSLKENTPFQLLLYFPPLRLAKVSIMDKEVEKIGWTRVDLDFTTNKENGKAINLHIDTSAEVIDRLLDKIVSLEQEKTLIEEKYSDILKVYKNLKYSKLGKVQTRYWNFKQRRKRK